MRIEQRCRLQDQLDGISRQIHAMKRNGFRTSPAVQARAGRVGSSCL
jgi:hypothetical protein